VTDLLADISLGELLVRMSATSLIVIVVATAVGKLGPLGGGLVAGLPISLGPGFYFLLGTSTPDFLGQTATFSLLALSVTQLFLTAYMATARFDMPAASLVFAVCVWGAGIAVLEPLPVTPASAALLFGAITVSAYWFGRRFQAPNAGAGGQEGFRLLLVRAGIAGLLVAVVTAAAASLGPELAGMLLAFPVGYALISITIHERFGSASVIGTLHSALLGTIGLAAFCAAFAVSLETRPATGAFLIGLAASVTITALMLGAARFRAR